MSKIKNKLIWLWQLPQNLLGLAYKHISKNGRIIEIENDDIRKVGAKCFLQRHSGGVTLGEYIFINQNYRDNSIVIKHECGHVLQSKYLGPLYLLVIGIPSILHAYLNNYIGCCTKNGTYNYYHFYTEKWANKLIGINL